MLLLLLVQKIELQISILLMPVQVLQYYDITNSTSNINLTAVTVNTENDN